MTWLRRVVRVGIVGAGLAGLAAALAAADAGCRVEVFESSPRLPESIGHIDVVPNLLRALTMLGLGDECVRRGFPYRGLAIVDGDGRCHVELPTPALAGARWPEALGMVHGELLGLMLQRALSRGVAVHFGHPVRDVGADRGVVLRDGRPHAVDLVIVASGTTMPLIGGADATAMVLDVMPQVWCHALLPRPLALHQATWVAGHDATRAMLVPVAMHLAGIAVLRPAHAPRHAAAVRRAFAGEGGLLRDVAASWHDDTPLTARHVRSGVLDGPWHQHGVLRIGQSAHLLPPHFGQAAAQAVEDAVVLGELLRTQTTREALLESFAARRMTRVRSLHAISAQAARWQLRPVAETDLVSLHDQLRSKIARPA